MKKVILKIVLLPLVCTVTFIQWVLIFLNHFSSIIFNILAGGVFLLAFASIIFQTADSGEILDMLKLSFCIFIFPHICNWVITRICLLNLFLRNLSE